MDSTSLYSGSGLEFVGWENYNYIFNKDPWFSITIVDGLKDLILQIPAIVIFALFMAIILVNIVADGLYLKRALCVFVAGFAVYISHLFGKRQYAEVKRDVMGASWAVVVFALLISILILFC